MKKLILCTFACLASLYAYDVAAAMPVPVMGVPIGQPQHPVALVGNVPNARTHGSILREITTSPHLGPERLVVGAFSQRYFGPWLGSYQQFLDTLENITDTDEALEVIAAFEKTIMFIFNYQVYIYARYNPNINIFVTGIRYPTACLFKDSQESHLLINELDRLADIAFRHSTPVGLRMKATVHSYRHWRRNLLITCAACLTANLMYRGWKKSSARALTHGIVNPVSMGAIATNLGSDAVSAVQIIPAIYSTVKKHIVDPYVAPVLARVLFGSEEDRKATKEAATQLTSTITTKLTSATKAACDPMQILKTSAQPFATQTVAAQRLTPQRVAIPQPQPAVTPKNPTSWYTQNQYPSTYTPKKRQIMTNDTQYPDYNGYEYHE